jgi:hypothetical protein
MDQLDGNDPERPPSALTPHERDQLLHDDDLRTEC